jgi:dTDP-4-amino-4,6-dideoxygalactose transaminase
MKVPLLDLKQQNAPLAAELRAAFERVLASGQFILGPEVEELERQTAALVEVKHAVGVSSGTDAILLALMALGIGPGDEVICPSFTFFATAGCVARVGAKPVFADSCPVCFNLDVEDAARRITPRTRAIIPVHLFGQAAEMERVVKLAEAHGLAVIEDAAQALGAAYRGRRVGSIGTIGTFSFYPSKNLGGFAEGGLLVTSDDGLAERARLMRAHGAQAKYFHKIVGGNFRLAPLHAALLSVKLPHLAGYSEARMKNACYYTTQLRELKGVADGAKAEYDEPEARAAFIMTPAAHSHKEHIWNQYTLRVAPGEKWKAGNPRDALRKHLVAREIGSEIYYPRPMHLQECFAHFGPYPALPVCERLAAECLSIPVYPELSQGQKDAVVTAIAEFLAENS